MMVVANILVIVVTYNAMKWSERCFSSLKTSSVPVDVFVVDNGSTDGTQVYIKNNYSDFIFHQSESNLGFGKANNLGLEYAIKNNYDYVYLLNQDAWIESDTIEKLLGIFSKTANLGILSPMQMNSSLTVLDNSFFFNLPKSFVNDSYLSSLKEYYDVDFVMAAHWMIPVSCLKKVGLFSSVFPHYGEDNNLVDRFHYWGYKVGISTDTKVVHDREFRDVPIEKKIYMLYIDTLIASCDINKSMKSSFLKAIKFIIKMSLLSIKTCHFRKLSYILMYLVSVPKIISARSLFRKSYN
ncbi:MAG: glycosyltransferase [Paludibacteraceae bacterium]|nr:glycosyltransferase [Paludibacteraceae bacterium]